MHALVTGTAGFIGFHLVNRLLKEGYSVTGIDSINEYYDPKLKYSRLKAAGINQEAVQYNQPVASSLNPDYRFIQLKLDDREGMENLFKNSPHFDVVVNLAAQAGVRYSLSNPHVYAESNIMGFVNLLECCRHYNIHHLVYASSSSVYGLNETIPFSEKQSTNHPISLYAASKKSNELMAHTYSHLFGLPTTGLRFFTVYGPWGRPDMALFLFTKAILEGKPIQVFNQGDMQRDFTYVDDIVEGVFLAISNPAKPNPDWDGNQPEADSSKAPYRIYNIGNSKPVKLLDFIEAIEEKTGKTAEKIMLPMQPGDVPATYADVTTLSQQMGYNPTTTVREGVGKFVDWYRKFYNM
jgi:UDP-glucuronate 4-epimerase